MFILFCVHYSTFICPFFLIFSFFLQGTMARVVWFIYTCTVTSVISTQIPSEIGYIEPTLLPTKLSQQLIVSENKLTWMDHLPWIVVGAVTLLFIVTICVFICYCVMNSKKAETKQIIVIPRNNSNLTEIYETKSQSSSAFGLSSTKTEQPIVIVSPHILNPVDSNSNVPQQLALQISNVKKNNNNIDNINMDADDIQESKSNESLYDHHSTINYDNEGKISVKNANNNDNNSDNHDSISLVYNETKTKTDFV